MSRIEFLHERLSRDYTLLPISLANLADATKDRDGSTSDLHGRLVRAIGIREFVLNHDRAKFTSLLRDSADIALKLFDRHKRSDGVDDSFVSMLSYKNLFDALAIGDMKVAKSLAGHMGGRGDIEKQHDHPFDRALGYCLRAFVLLEQDEILPRLARFRAECDKKAHKDFRGYVTVFEAILEHDTGKADTGFAELLKGHRRQSKGNGVFRFTPDEDLCVWGLGMANLARHHGLPIEISDPLIPSELIV